MTPRKVSVLLHTMFILAYLLSAPAFGSKPSPSTYKKISDISWGRFVAWPSEFQRQSNAQEFYEEDLFQRVYADHLRKSHKDLERWDLTYPPWEDWTVYFGAAADSDNIASIPAFESAIDCNDVNSVNAWPLEQNWVYKRFAVVRTNATSSNTVIGGNYDARTYTYSVSANCLSPGTRIQTANNVFYLKNSNHAFGYLSYMSKVGRNTFNVVQGDFSAPDNAQQAPQTAFAENWLLLFDTINVERRVFNVTIPVLLTFSHKPTVVCNADYITLTFPDKDPSEDLTVVISLPYGVNVAATDIAPLSQWTSELPNDVIARCRLVNRMANNWPIAVEETYAFEEDSGPTPSRVAVTNRFSFSYMNGDWKLTPAPYAVLPPLVSLAGRAGLNVDIPLNAIDSDIPTKYGPYLIVDLPNDDKAVVYEIPGAPEHDVHLVGTHKNTNWKQKINRMLNASAILPDKYRLDDVTTFNGGLFCAVANRGEAAALPMAFAYTKTHYVDWMRQVVDNYMFSASEWKRYEYDNILPPAEESWPYFWTCLADTNPAPWDIDAFAGANLEFIYECALWAGNWQTVESQYDAEGMSIVKMFEPLELFHDWGFMSGSLNVYGSGSTMDMFNAQFEGYLAYAKLSAALGNSEEAGWARYLAAKAQIPFVMRWAGKEYISQYFKTELAGATSVISGFGEAEPAGPLLDNFNQVFLLNGWGDFTISGEQVHPLGYDVLRTLCTEPFGNALELFDAEFRASVANCAGGSLLDAGFGENKLYSFFRYRDLKPDMWSKLQLEQMLDLFYTDYTTNSISHFAGPSMNYLIFKCSDEEWYGSASATCESFAKTAIISPLMPAMIEAYHVPIRLGAWAPAVLDTALYNWETQTFTAHFMRPEVLPADAPTPTVRLQVDRMPLQISGDIALTGECYDPIWKVLEIPLAAGLSEWSVTVGLAPAVDAEWGEDPVNENLIRDPCFEESGMGTAEAPRPNIELAWSIWPLDTTMFSVSEVTEGNQCARINMRHVNAGAQLYQNLWVGPSEASEETIPVYVSFKYKFDYCDANLVSEYLMRFAIESMPKDIGGEDQSTTILNKIIFGRDNEWHHYDCGQVNVPSTRPVLGVHFYVEDNLLNGDWTDDVDHSVCIDSVVVTCPLLDMGYSYVLAKTGIAQDSSSERDVLSNCVSYPNPFNPAIRIDFELGFANKTELKIYDVAGRLVTTIVDDVLPAGKHGFTWHGSNSKGWAVSSGVYFYRLRVGNKEAKGKLSLLR